MDSHDHEVLPLAQPLTGRELEVLTHIGEGLANREIAEQMTVALSTVKWYVRQIYNKLGVQNRAEAIIRAKDLGLLPDLDAADRQRIKLPPQLTSFVGRRREIGEVRQLLMTSRLVTLTGPGGSGKTRLALQVARESAGQFGDGVFFVSLASTIDPALVPNTIAHELGIDEQPNLQLIDTLQSYFAEKQLLLLIDSFEHVLDAASIVSDILSVTTRLTVLVTSQEALHLSGEFEYLVPPLSIPDPSRTVSATEILRFESVDLFVQRAEAVSTYFALTEDNAATVANICSRLDGLPLAIELAAARVKLFKPKLLLERLESRLGILTGGPRDLPARQRTLRNTIDWSYKLLNEDEQRLFSSLGVFAGSASLEAIEAICSPGLGIDILDGLESLLNKSFLYQEDGPGEAARFKMLETIHEYANECLAQRNDLDRVKDRHLEFFVQVAREAEPHLRSSEQVTWQKQMEIDYDNFRAALEWALAAEGRADTGLHLAGSLAAYWETRSILDEGRQYLSAALERSDTRNRTAARAKALRNAGLMAYIQSDYPAARDLLEESLSIHRELDPKYRRGLADALITLGDVETELGDYALATSLMNEGLAIMREVQDDRGIARALWQLGACAVRPGDYEQAIRYFEEALPLLRRIGDRTHTAIALSGLAEVAIRQGEYERASALEKESLTLRREIDETWGIAVSLGNLAWIALGRDDLQQAITLLEESMSLRCDIGDKGGVAWCLEKVAAIELGRGLDSATPERGDHFRHSATIFGAAAALREPSGSIIDLVDQPQYDRQLSVVKAQMKEIDFTVAWEEGRGMSMQQAVRYASAK